MRGGEVEVRGAEGRKEEGREESDIYYMVVEKGKKDRVKRK